MRSVLRAPGARRRRRRRRSSCSTGSPSTPATREASSTAGSSATHGQGVRPAARTSMRNPAGCCARDSSWSRCELVAGVAGPGHRHRAHPAPAPQGSRRPRRPPLDPHRPRRGLPLHVSSASLRSLRARPRRRPSSSLARLLPGLERWAGACSASSPGHRRSPAIPPALQPRVRRCWATSADAEGDGAADQAEVV